MMPLNYIPRKFTQLQKKINYLINMDDIRILAKNKNDLKTLMRRVRLLL